MQEVEQVLLGISVHDDWGGGEETDDPSLTWMTFYLRYSKPYASLSLRLSRFSLTFWLTAFFFTPPPTSFFFLCNPLAYKSPCFLQKIVSLSFSSPFSTFFLMTKRRNSIAEFSFQLSAIPTHYCPSDNGSIYNTSNDSESVCYLRQAQDDDSQEEVVPDLISNSILAHHHHKKSRATPSPPPQPLVKKFPHRSLSDSVLVVKEKASQTAAAIPSKIIPSWKPASHDEKPPYSYATLIAYAILTSPDRKLPLSDIYMTISSHFPYYVLGDNGWQVRLLNHSTKKAAAAAAEIKKRIIDTPKWSGHWSINCYPNPQNSIRHNLSLNKSFIKLDRKPSDARPGKGSYWTIQAGHEHGFVDSLTRPGGPLRKQTVNVGKRTLSNNIKHPHHANQHQSQHCENLLIMGPQDFEKCSKPTHSITTSLTSSELVSLPTPPSAAHVRTSSGTTSSQANSSSMITIFRMAPMVNDAYRPRSSMSRVQKKPYSGTATKSVLRKRRGRVASATHRHEDHDSDCDSGVDVGNEFVPEKLLDDHKKVTAALIESPYLMLPPASDDLILSDPDLSYLADCDSPTSCTLSSFLDEPASSPAAGGSFFSPDQGCEFEENLLLTQSSSLYSQEEEVQWTNDYLSW